MKLRNQSKYNLRNASRVIGYKPSYAQGVGVKTRKRRAIRAVNDVMAIHAEPAVLEIYPQNQNNDADADASDASTVTLADEDERDALNVVAAVNNSNNSGESRKRSHSVSADSEEDDHFSEEENDDPTTPTTNSTTAHRMFNSACMCRNCKSKRPRKMTRQEAADAVAAALRANTPDTRFLPAYDNVPSTPVIRLSDSNNSNNSNSSNFGDKCTVTQMYGGVVKTCYPPLEPYSNFSSILGKIQKDEHNHIIRILKNRPGRRDIKTLSTPCDTYYDNRRSRFDTKIRGANLYLQRNHYQYTIPTLNVCNDKPAPQQMKDVDDVDVQMADYDSDHYVPSSPVYDY